MGREPKPLAERFWPKVEKHCEDECWPWRGAHNNKGYGVVRSPEGPLLLAHRVALVLDGRDPGALVARHTCDNRECVNPAHLLLGTHLDNCADARERLRLAGERNGFSKLTDDDVRAIRASAGGVETQRSIAARFGVAESTVSEIVHGRLWTHVTAEAA